MLPANLENLIKRPRRRPLPRDGRATRGATSQGAMPEGHSFLVVWRSDPPFVLSQTATMRFSPFPILLAALAIGTVWAGHDASARFNRCTESQSLAHCRLIFYGR